MRATLLHRSDDRTKRDRQEGRSTHRVARARVRPGQALAGLAVAILLAAPACASSTTAPETGTATTEAPGRATVAPAPATAAAPGTVIASNPIEAVPGGRAEAFTYHSTDASGADIAVSAVFLAPDGPAPEGGFPLITWGHPTTGAADGCQPSIHGVASLPYPEDLVGRGWAVVATDYEGLGSAGPHPYLVGASEGHAVLDAARAAAQLPGSGVAAGGPVVIWGFSQGGHAAAFAAQLAPAYAPDLDVVATAIAAPVSDVAGFTRRAEALPDQLGVVLTTVSGFAAAYPELDPGSVLTPDGVALLGEVEQRCIGEINEHATRPVAEVIATPPTADPAFAARFAENRAGDAPVGVPVLVVQGADDDIVDPAATMALVERWCARGVVVESVVRPGVDHGVLAPDPFLGWIADRLAGVPPTSTC
jgi:alpha-beta hydrolase superfamily lysophospholipase